MNYRNIIGNIGAIYIFAQAIFPGLNGAMIVAAVLDGTIVPHLFDLGLAYVGFQYGKEDNVNVKYVT
jgi:hypothetical protein